MHAVGVGGVSPQVFTFTDGHAAVKFAEGFARRCSDPIKVAEIDTEKQRAGLKACPECGAVFSKLGPDNVLMDANKWFRKTYCTRECSVEARNRERYRRRT